MGKTEMEVLNYERDTMEPMKNEDSKEFHNSRREWAEAAIWKLNGINSGKKVLYPCY